MERKTKIILGVSTVILLGIISFLVYWFTKEEPVSSPPAEKSDRLNVPGNIIEFTIKPDNKIVDISQNGNYYLIKREKDSLYARCETPFSATQTVEGPSSSKFRLYCPDLENPRCKPGKTDVRRFNCPVEPTLTKTIDFYTIHCGETNIQSLPVAECENPEVSCLNGKCTACCDTTIGATGFCDYGMTLFRGKCNETEVPVCNESGCSFTCNGTKTVVKNTSIKSLNKKCINGQCLVCGNYEEGDTPSCIYGEKKISGTNTKSILGGCESTDCGIVADWTKEPGNIVDISKVCNRNLNYSCINGNCVACC